MRGSRGRHRGDRGSRSAAPTTADGGAARAAKVALRSAWRKAAGQATGPSSDAVQPRKRARSGGDSKGLTGFTARSLAADYLALCQNPLQDLQRWIAADKKRPGGTGSVFQRTTNRGGSHAYNRSHIGETGARRLSGHPLPPLRGRMDAHAQGRRDDHGLPARSRACAGRYDELRSLRAEGIAGRSRPGGDSRDADLAFRGGRATLLALYGAKIEATRRSLPQREIAAALRALRDDRHAALRAFTEHRRAVLKGAREQRRAERFSGRANARSRTLREPARVPAAS